MKLNAYLVKSTVVAALGGLLFGFDTAVISGTTSALASTYDLSPTLLGVTVASALYQVAEKLGVKLNEWDSRRQVHQLDSRLRPRRRYSLWWKSMPVSQAV